MKHTLTLLTALLLAPPAALHAANFPAAPGDNDGAASTSSAAVLEIPPHPTSFPTNGTWSVYCRNEGSDEWREMPVALVRPGYQEFDEPFAKTVGLEHQGPYAASLVRFSFSGNLEIKAVFNKGDLRTAAIVPKSYAIKSQPQGNEFKFTISQDSKAPRKIVIRPNDNWEEDVLHILTNPPEDTAPSETDPAVLCIAPGDPIPEVLPAGKTTYYFKPGIHRLPQGLWLDIDLGSVQTVNSFDLLTGGQRKWLVPGPMKYRISYRDREDAPWQTAVENLTNDSIEIKGGVLPAFQARHVRLTLLGNTSQERSEGLYYVNSTHLTHFRLYGTDKGRDLAAGRAYRGAVPGFERVTGNNSHWGWGDMYGGESFFAAGDGITFYLAPGSVVKGSLAGNGRKNITIKGRGIIDGSELLHEPSKVYREARTGTLRFHNCTNVLLEGICILDSPMWSMQFKGSTDVIVRHIDFIGNIVNADGVHLSAVKNGLVEGCFLRAPDDLFLVYHYGASEDLTVRNCVFWNDGGSIVLIGIADNKGDIRNVIVEKCDILTSQGVWTRENAAAIHIAATAGNTISGVVFQDVRIEPFRFPSTTALLMIKAKEFKVGVHRYSPGRVSDVLFDRVTYDGSGEAPSFIQGTDADHTVKGVVFRKFFWGDRYLSEEDHPNLFVRPFSSEITFQ